MKRVECILEIAKEMQGKDCDSVFIVVGRERSGKTHFVLSCIDYLGAGEESIVVDKKELGESMSQLKDCGVLHFDEAADGLLSKDGMNKWNKELERLFMIIGAKRLITFIVIPDFFLLSPYFRKHRVVGLFWVYKRGGVAFYDKYKIEKINYYHDRYKITKFTVRPSFYDRFYIYKGRLLEAYLKKKNAKVNGLINEFNERVKANPKCFNGESKKERIIDLLKQGWKVSDIAKEVKATRPYISDIKKIYSEM